MEQSRGAAITLDHFIALNAEIGALARAGIPLEQGLSHLGRDMPGKLGKTAARIAARLERGDALSDVFREYSADIPPVYRAVVEAGARSGRLAAALESVADSARRIADMRRLVIGAIFYPLIVFLLAWGLWVAFVAGVVPRFIPVFEDFNAYGLGVLKAIGALSDTAIYWGPMVPAIILFAAGTWWYSTVRGAIAEPRLAAILLGCFPWIGRVLRLQRAAAFAEVLALLVEHQTPFDQGLRLAAEACGDPRIGRSARALAAALERGELPKDSRGFRGFPPLVQWMLAGSPQQGNMVGSLRHAARMYQKQASHQASVAGTYLPVVMTLVLGGSVTAAYVFLVMGPWIAMLQGLSRPLSP